MNSVPIFVWGRRRRRMTGGGGEVKEVWKEYSS